MARVTPYTPEELAARKERAREYNARPEVKARKKAHASKPEVAAKRAEYYARPDVKQRYKDRLDKEAHKAYCKAWRQSETGKAILKAAGLKQRAFTLELWATLMNLQGGACAICRKPFTADLRAIHADHCHDEMKPRGLLCQACNHAEGQIKKTGLTPSEFARRLEAYLACPPAQSVQQAIEPLEHTA